MPRKDELHALVHSLSPNEKRYFRLFSSLQSATKKQNYLRIFEALLDMEEYDPGRLRKALDDDSILRHLAAEKNYLFRLILKSMRVYRSRATRRARLSGLISDAIFLYDKALYDASARIFAKARKIALEIEDHAQLYHVLLWERRVLKRGNRPDGREKQREIVRLKQDLLRRLREDAALIDLYDELYLSLREGAPDVREIGDHPAMRDAEGADSFSAVHLKHEITALTHIAAGDYGPASACYALLVDHWEAHPAQVREDPFLYLSILGNYLTLAVSQNDFSRFPRILERLRGFDSDSPHGRFLIRNILYFQELIYCLNTGRLHEGQELIAKVAPWLEAEKEVIGVARLLSYQLNLALLCWFSGDHSGALRWTNAMLNMGRLKERREIQRFVRVLQVVLHFEMEHYDLCESLGRSAWRFLNTQDGRVEFEKTVLRAIRNALKATGPKAASETFRELRDALKTLADDPEEDRATGFRETLIWAESKCRGAPMREVAPEFLPQWEG